MEKIILRVLGAALVAALVSVTPSMIRPLVLVVSLVVGLVSFVLMIVSRRQLGGSFSVRPEARELITKGLYARIQHPMYVFLDLFLASVIAALGVPVFLWGGVFLSLCKCCKHNEKKKRWQQGSALSIKRTKVGLGSSGREVCDSARIMRLTDFP